MDFRSHSIVLGEDTIENLYQKKKDYQKCCHSNNWNKVLC